jgi:rSAM/selenodomain-associated transferase 2
MKVSVIIPALNEAGVLVENLKCIRELAPHEIIVVDGESQDRTQAIAKHLANKTVISSPGRAAQMNAGAQSAEGDLLLFLHADSLISKEGYLSMLRVMDNEHIAGGAFGLKIDSNSSVLKFIAFSATLRAKYFGLVYGDQAIFVRRKVFEKIKGYSSLPICEDLEFYRRLQKNGQTVLLKEEAITSARRWEKEGIVFTTARNILIVCLFLLKFPPQILSKWYLSIR